MQITKIDDTISVGGQITTADIQRLADLGFKGIICNRPDNEDYIQTGYSDIEAAAAAAGMGVRYVPIAHGSLSMDDVVSYGNARGSIEGPHFAYCQAGMRAVVIWGLHEATTGVDVSTILNKAGSAGFQLNHMAGVLGQLSASAA